MSRITKEFPGEVTLVAIGPLTNVAIGWQALCVVIVSMILITLVTVASALIDHSQRNLIHIRLVVHNVIITIILIINAITIIIISILVIKVIIIRDECRPGAC